MSPHVSLLLPSACRHPCHLTYVQMPASFGAYCTVGLQPPKGVQPNHCKNWPRSWVQDGAIIAIALPRMIRLVPSRKTPGGTDSPTSPSSLPPSPFSWLSSTSKFPPQDSDVEQSFPGQHAAYPVKLYFTHRMRTSLVRRLLMNPEAQSRLPSPSVLYQHYPLSYLTHIDCKHMRTIHQNYPSVHYKIPFCVMPCTDLKNRF